MMKSVFLVFALLGAIALTQGKQQQPCTSVTLECVKEHFEQDVEEEDPLADLGAVASTTVDSSALLESVMLSTNDKDSGTARYVVIELPNFNFTITKNNMKVAGLSKAKFQKFVVDYENQKAFLTVHYPKLTFSGTNQRFNFYKNAEMDIEVSQGLEYNFVFEEIYTTTVYKVNTNQKVLVATGVTHTEIKKLPKLTAPAPVQAAAKQTTWVNDSVNAALANPQTFMREYLLSVGVAVEKMFMTRSGFF